MGLMLCWLSYTGRHYEFANVFVVTAIIRNGHIPAAALCPYLALRQSPDIRIERNNLVPGDSYDGFHSWIQRVLHRQRF